MAGADPGNFDFGTAILMKVDAQGRRFYLGSSLVGLAVSSFTQATPSHVLMGMLAPTTLAFLVALMGLRSTLQLDLPKTKSEGLACE